ncbi:hypothetical protein CERZMDRAFT_33651 [Cercospora zeae-maydis SCOH1-5]|uniref:DUF1772 domain-containing protein n=1 Tax=Cercospora zeae-maydis SCOH1-5 TaxID=717836 RepID=A0A6A6FT07_9PEZI|nr:hypothetical protein CERZMDRAFT_33651 [Cercospora zeae-maydis SCOH1-5]
MTTTGTAAQVLSISVALVGAGGIAALSLFDVPELQAQPADRSLPAIRWLFSRGSHIFPQAATLSAAGFAYAAYDTLPAHTRSLNQLLQGTNPKTSGFVAAAVLAISIAPFTSYMLSNNFALIEKNEKLGGARSQKSAEQQRQQGQRPGQGSAEDSVNNKRGVDEFGDLSNPMEKTDLSSSEADDTEVRERLGKFGRQNMVRAVLLGGGGIVGLVTALL